MGQLLVQGVVIGVVMVISVATTMTSMVTVTDTSSLRTSIYIFASKYGISDAVDKVSWSNAESTASERLFQDSSSEVNFEGDKLGRKIRNGAVSSGRRQETPLKCHDMDPKVRAIIQANVKSNLEDPYYHVPRAVFIHRPSSYPVLPAGLHIENALVTIFAANYHPRCHPQCPVRLRLLPPEPDRLWPRNLVVAECACNETSCSGRGPFQCRQDTAPVLIVRGAPGQLPRYCTEWVSAGCRCIPVRTEPAARHDPLQSRRSTRDTLK